MDVPSTIYQLNFNTTFSSFPLIASFSDDEIDTYSACPFKELIDEKKEKGLPFVLAVMQDKESFNMRCYSAHELPLIKDLKKNPHTKQDINSLFYFVLARNSDHFQYAGNSNDEFLRVVQFHKPGAVENKIVEFKLNSLFAPLNMRAIVSLKDVEMRSNELDFPSLLAFHPQLPGHKVRCFDAAALERSNESLKLTTALFFTQTLKDYEFVGAFKDGKVAENHISLHLKANNGDRESLYQLGKYYLEKSDKHVKFGFKLMAEAAKKEFIPALMELGRFCLYNNYGFELNVDLSKQIFENILKSNPKPPSSVINEAKLLLAFSNYYLRDFETAQKLVSEFLKVNPTHRQACMLMAICYFKRSSAKNYLQSAKKYAEFVLEKNAKKGVLDPTISVMLNLEHEARFLLHRIYDLDGESVKGLKFLMDLANDGHSGAQYILGMRFMNGDGVVQNQISGFKLLNKSALSYVPAEFELGNCYKNGHGVKKDLKSARKYIISAAEKGHLDARRMLITENEQLELPADQFIHWLIVSINKDEEYSTHSMYLLAECYMEGYGVEKNFESAFDYWATLVNLNHTPALHAIGKRYFEGRGVAKDIVKAYAYWKKAAIHGYIPSLEALKNNSLFKG